MTFQFQPGGKKVVGLESAILEIHRFFKSTFILQSEKKTVTMLQVLAVLPFLLHKAVDGRFVSHKPTNTLMCCRTWLTTRPARKPRTTDQTIILRLKAIAWYVTVKSIEPTAFRVKYEKRTALVLNLCFL